MNKMFKAHLSKVIFFLSRSPVIEKAGNTAKYIPAGHKSVITITADFELAWAPRYSKKFSNPLQESILLAKLERENVPYILELCYKYNIPVTWAIVGHLFLKECAKVNALPHFNLPRQKKYENDYWKFTGNDWFEYDPCSNFKDAPEWYAPDLIEQILSSKVRHEIGCHTFSHIDCREEVCSSELFEAEISECKKVAANLGLKLKSFVHPGHTIGNLNKLAELGFTSFQTDPGNILGYPVKHTNGLWELKRTYEFAYRKEWSVDYHIYRYKTIIDRAIKNNAVCNFWFHPSFEKKFLTQILPEIFRYLDEKREQVLITTAGAYTNWLNDEIN